MNDQSYTVIRNGTILTPFEEIKDGTIVVQDSKIVEVGSRGQVQEPAGADVVDADGGYIVPGLIDIHVHGSNGADVLDATPEALETMSTFFVAHGVTAFLVQAQVIPATNISCQWLVPAERLILLNTLYLPEGLRIGMRFTSSSVVASKTTRAPSISHRLTSA